jgi:ABC-type glycerol-3-phosphate transport system substrate-binding protein
MKRGVLVIAFVAVLAVIFLIVSILSRSKTEVVPEISLKIHAPFDEKAVYEQIGQGFFNETGVKVEFSFINKGNAKDYEAAVVDEIASGTGPDIWLIRNDWLGKHEGKITPMPATLSWTTDRKVTNEQALQNVFGAAVQAQNSLGGQMFAVPLSVDSLALYVNTSIVNRLRQDLNNANDRQAELFASAPKTWADVEQWSQLITQRSGNGFARSGLAAGTLENTYAPTDLYLALLHQKGGRLYDPQTRQPTLHLASAEGSIPGQAALEFLRSFSDPGSANYSWNRQAGDPVKQFVEGKAALMVGFSTLRYDFFQLNKDFNSYYVAALPQQEQLRLPTDRRTDYAAYWTHVVPKTSAYPDLAWQFLKYLMSFDNQRYYAEQTLKPVLGMLGDVESPRNETLPSPQVFATQVVNAPAIFKPEWLFVDESLQAMLRSTFDATQTPQIALDTTAEILKGGR